MSAIVIGFFQAVQVEHHKAQPVIRCDSHMDQFVALVPVIQTSRFVTEQLVLCIAKRKNSDCHDIHSNADHGEKQQIGRMPYQKAKHIQQDRQHQANYRSHKQLVPHVVSVPGINDELQYDHKNCFCQNQIDKHAL